MSTKRKLEAILPRRVGSVGPWLDKLVAASLSTRDIVSPATGEVIGQVELATALEVHKAVECAQQEFTRWGGQTIKRRAQIMLKFHALVESRKDELINLIMLENGKNRVEAAGDVAKGLETVEWACSMPQLAYGRHLTVSSGITCHEIRDPVGVVASIVPFNFPFMVPFWTLPIALVAGNCVILKPSEKVPMTMALAAELLFEAGVPRGAFQMVQGEVDVVNALCDHEGICALTFVGSSRVAKLVHDRARAAGKKVIALGGAKNYLVAAPDRDLEMASADIVASFAGCAGQRCMAASVLITIGEQPELIAAVVAKAALLQAGQDGGCVGPVIDMTSRDRILKGICKAAADGAEVLLDGRAWAERKEGGWWVGPTVLRLPASMLEHEAVHAETFGPGKTLKLILLNLFLRILNLFLRILHFTFFVCSGQRRLGPVVFFCLLLLLLLLHFLLRLIILNIILLLLLFRDDLFVFLFFFLL